MGTSAVAARAAQPQDAAVIGAGPPVSSLETAKLGIPAHVTSTSWRREAIKARTTYTTVLSILGLGGALLMNAVIG